MSNYASAFLGLLLISGAHLFVGRAFDKPQRGAFLLHALTGVAIAYAFVDVFPHLASMQARLEATGGAAWFTYLAHHVYLMALAGFLVYLGVQTSLVEARREGSAESVAGLRDHRYAFLVLSMCLYNFLIGYMLSEQPTHRPAPALLFGAAMAAHVLGLNHENRRADPVAYDRQVRYLFVLSVAAGWVTGYAFEMSDATYALWFAYLAGGIICAGVATELPRIRTLRAFGSFAAGAVAFCLLILLLETFRD